MLVISNLDKAILSVKECVLYTKFMVVHVLCTNSLTLLRRNSIQNVQNDVAFSYSNRNDIQKPSNMLNNTESQLKAWLFH